ncbi:MAG: prepilin peptidase [Anaerolineales bacterium]|nr:prepilin peptidase [Anaerolineales bacterium]
MPNCYNDGMITPILIGLVGWVTGTFVNYLSDVLPHKRRLTQPFCLNCSLEQPFLDYFVWPRKCQACDSRRSFRVWFVEILAVPITIWLWYSPPEPLGFWVGLFLLAFFAVVIVIDIEHRLILHPVSIFGAIVGLGIGTWLNGLQLTLLGGAAGFGIMLVLYLGGILFAKVVSRLKGRDLDEEALGFGDVNLSGVLGLMLGWPVIFAGLFIAILAGAIISIILMIGMLITRKYRTFVAIPYGPFLVAGAIFLIYFREFILAHFG